MSQQNRSKINRVDAIMSLNRALWGEVSPQLRSASIKWGESTITLFFHYDGKISESDRESAECVATEVVSDFPGFTISVEVVRLDYPAPIPQEGELVYKRRELTPTE